MSLVESLVLFVFLVIISLLVFYAFKDIDLSQKDSKTSLGLQPAKAFKSDNVKIVVMENETGKMIVVTADYARNYLSFDKYTYIGKL